MCPVAGESDSATIAKSVPSLPTDMKFFPSIVILSATP